MSGDFGFSLKLTYGEETEPFEILLVCSYESGRPSVLVILKESLLLDILSLEFGDDLGVSLDLLPVCLLHLR